MIRPNKKIKSCRLTIIKAQENIKKTLTICSIRKFISPFLNVQTTNNLSNLFPGQDQAEYYLLGPRIILITALYSTFLQTINPLFPPLESWPHKNNFADSWWTRLITFLLYPLQEDFLNYTRVSVKLNCSSKYFIQNNSEVNSNPYSSVLQESPAKYGLLRFKFPKVTYRDTELSN